VRKTVKPTVKTATAPPVAERSARREEKNQMGRMTYDGLLLQAQLAPGERCSIDEIAKLFRPDGETGSAVAHARAQRAAMNLVTMGYGEAVPSRSKMTHITSTASPGTQLAALMNLAIRRAIAARAEHDPGQAQARPLTPASAGERDIVGEAP
jgi:hypothetical protein